MNTSNIILASSSPRRRDLLSNLGYYFKICPPSIDETIKEGELPIDYVMRIAKEKALEVFKSNLENIVISADTIVVLNNKILGKPKDRSDFTTNFLEMSNKEHFVYTAYCICKKSTLVLDCVATTVRFRQIKLQEVYDYWNTGEPIDKAGGYAIQGIGGKFVKSINGSYSNVVGFPQVEIFESLKKIL
ncbi:MAG: Maf family protein [Succinivibrionaceae bacterium]